MLIPFNLTRDTDTRIMFPTASSVMCNLDQDLVTNDPRVASGPQ